jgi:tetratricopeptide (TPR) repeat protein
MMYSGGEPGTLDPNSGFGRLIGTLFPDVFWRRFGVGGALDHYNHVNRLRPDFIMAHYFRGNVFNDWGSQFAGKTQEAFQAGDVAQAEVFRKRTDELWSKAMDAYDSTRKLGPNYVQMHHQVGTVHQKWGDFFNSLAPMAEKYGRKELAAEYRQLAREHWLKAVAAYQLYYKIDPVFDQNFYRLAQVYIQLGDFDKAEQTYIDHLQARECKKPYHQIFDGFYVKIWNNKNRYDLASIYHTHDVVNVARPEGWMFLGDYEAYVRTNLPRAEEAYRRAVEIRPDNVDFMKRLATFYQRSNRIPEATECWKKVYALNPQDPDVQKLIHVQPAHP